MTTEKSYNKTNSAEINVSEIHLSLLQIKRRNDL